MKKLITLMALALLLAFKTDTPQILTVSGDQQSWQAVLECIEQSNAPHSQVVAVQKWIVGQLHKQLADSTKINQKK